MAEKLVNSRGEQIRLEPLFDYIRNYPELKDSMVDFIRWSTATGICVSAAILQRKYGIGQDEALYMKEAFIESGAALVREGTYFAEFSLNEDQAEALASELELRDSFLEHKPDLDLSPEIENVTGRAKEFGIDFTPLLGTYQLETSGERVLLPLGELCVWAIIESDGEKRLLLAKDSAHFEAEDGQVILSGECEYIKGNLWRMPDCVREFLGSEKLVLIGCYRHAELMTLAAFDKNLARDLDDIFNIDI